MQGKNKIYKTVQRGHKSIPKSIKKKRSQLPSQSYSNIMNGSKNPKIEHRTIIIGIINKVTIKGT